MAYDAYGRPLMGRGNDPSGYFDPSDATPEYARHYASEQHQRDRDNLNPPRWNHAHQRYSPPILNERMTTAPERSEPGPAEKGHENVSPELIAAITAKVKKEVMEHLKQTGSVEEPARPAPMQRLPSNRSNSTSSPPLSTRRVYTPPSPAQPPPKSSYPPPPMDTTRSPPGSPMEKPSGVRFSDRGATRPAPGTRSYSTMELSTVDQKWGRLFDLEGKPTQRLGQFLRGLANHIIEDYAPKRSIVVTPAKMAAYYSSHSLEKEPHQLISIFRTQSNELISQLYQDLGCQHHLIQEQASLPCVVPALTPLGFAHWMTIHILAYPEDEWRRLEKVVLAMPVDADGEMIDGKPERLPKQISRYLLPELEDSKSRRLLDGAVKDFLADLASGPHRKKSITSPPRLSRQQSTSQSRRDSQSRRSPVEIHQEKPSQTTPKPKPIERERAPYSGAPGSDISSNDEGIKLERDRQPYTAQPGNGRVFENVNLPNRSNRANSTSRTREPDIPEARHVRTQSDARRESYNPQPRPSNRRTSSPPLKSFSNSTPLDINSSSYVPNISYGPGQTTFNARPHGSSSSGFPPPPPLGDRRDQYGRRIPEEIFMEDFTSPRDAEKWDRYQESRAAGDPYDRGSVSVGPRDVFPSRGGQSEDWYRDSKPRGSGYEDFGPRRYA